MMVFRKLEQDVPEFNAYLKENGKRWKEFTPPGLQLTDGEGADLWGARMVGRWPSGAPLATCPYKDKSAVGDDSNKNNDFDYTVSDVSRVNPREPSDYYCPFTAHTRKTAPRNLDPYVSREYLKEGMIIRAGIPYGSEITKDEERTGESSTKLEDKRGLLFVSYQSSLDQGFVRQTRFYGCNDYFPPTSLVPAKYGQDPIIGGPPPEGSVGVQPKYGVEQKYFVTSRGGEYFFVPPISTLKKWAEGK